MTDTAPGELTSTEPNAEIQDMKVRTMLLVMMTSLVNEEEKLEIVRVGAEGGAAFQVRAASDDIGKLIGKSGRTARAIRIILSATSAKYGRRYTLDIGRPNS